MHRQMAYSSYSLIQLEQQHVHNIVKVHSRDTFSCLQQRNVYYVTTLCNGRRDEEIKHSHHQIRKIKHIFTLRIIHHHLNFMTSNKSLSSYQYPTNIYRYQMQWIHFHRPVYIFLRKAFSVIYFEFFVRGDYQGIFSYSRCISWGKRWWLIAIQFHFQIVWIPFTSIQVPFHLGGAGSLNELTMGVMHLSNGRHISVNKRILY